MSRVFEGKHRHRITTLMHQSTVFKPLDSIRRLNDLQGAGEQRLNSALSQSPNSYIGCARIAKGLDKFQQLARGNIARYINQGP